MIVPGAKGGMPVPGSAEQPSEANLLMALAEMKNQGRFQVAQEARPGAEDNNPPADRSSEFEAAVRKHGETRIDPNYPSMKEFLKNLPADIEQGKDGGGSLLRLKKQALTS